MQISIADLESGGFLWPSRRTRESHDLHYPPAAIKDALVAWIEAWGRGATPSAFAAEHGLEHQSIRVDSRDIALLREKMPLRYGVGTFLMSAHHASPTTTLLIEAPHEPFDKGTGTLAWTLFRVALQRLDRVALFVNQAHRYEKPIAGGPADIVNPYDVCHNDDHPFHQASLAWMRQDARTLAVQIHGFASGDSAASTSQRPPPGALAVVSAGTRHPPFAARDAWRLALQRAAGAEILVFPGESEALGATTNVLAQALNARTNAFVHIEMAASLRSELTSDGEKRRIWAQTLVDEACRNGALICKNPAAAPGRVR